MVKEKKQFRELSDEELKQVTGGGNWLGDLTVTGGAGSRLNPIDNLDNGGCLSSRRESCEMNGGTFTTDCHCIY